MNMKNLELKKMSLVNINGRLTTEEMENIMAGSTFCQGFGVVASAYEIGLLANWWNPVGWGGQVVIVGVGVYCIFN